MAPDHAVDPVIDDLATFLFALDLAGETTAAVTRRLTRAVGGWATQRGWTVRTEARMSVAVSPTSDGQLGYVDVIVGRGESAADLAIEIDSADKRWSVAKLQHAAAAGMHAIWIRWGDDQWAGIYDDVDVIQLRIARLPDRRHGGDAQLPLWPLTALRRGR